MTRSGWARARGSGFIGAAGTMIGTICTGDSTPTSGATAKTRPYSRHDMGWTVVSTTAVTHSPRADMWTMVQGDGRLSDTNMMRRRIKVAAASVVASVVLVGNRSV